MNIQPIQNALKDAARCLKGAQYLAEKAYPNGDAPAELLPALVIAVAICRFVTEDGGDNGHAG